MEVLLFPFLLMGKAQKDKETNPIRRERREGETKSKSKSKGKGKVKVKLKGVIRTERGREEDESERGGRDGDKEWSRNKRRNRVHAD